MKVSQLFSIFPQPRWGKLPITTEIKGITQDSREVEPGFVFVAVRGHSQDGHEYIKTAMDKGAVALVVEDSQKLPSSFSGVIVVVANGRQALNQLAARYYDNPAEKMFCAGVTGTNGKTSMVYMIEHLLTHFGWPTGVLGTIDHHLRDRVWASQLTTPDPITLQKRLKEFEAMGARAAAFEVSSHALDQHRADGIPFDAVVFTNLSRDHLDYHSSMEDYFRAKEKLFLNVLSLSKKEERRAIVNADDPYGTKIRLADGVSRWTYGRSAADFQFEVRSQDFSGSHFNLETPKGKADVFVPVPGLYNVYNATAAIAVALFAGLSLTSAVEALAAFKGVPGRLQPVENSQGFFIFVDYAHTDDALRNVLRSLNEVRLRGAQKSRILTLFGCGGDRDRGKRPLMAQAATQLSDQVIITSDNPRTEDPEKIIDDCVQGLSLDVIQKKVHREPDRRRAIEQILNRARKDDVILIAGKGHESYQIIGQEKRPFSDVQVVMELLK